MSWERLGEECYGQREQPVARSCGQGLPVCQKNGKEANVAEAKRGRCSSQLGLLGCPHSSNSLSQSGGCKSEIKVQTVLVPPEALFPGR